MSIVAPERTSWIVSRLREAQARAPEESVRASLERAILLLTALDDDDASSTLRLAARLPSLDAFPAGSRFRLFVDCESGNPKHWLEVGAGWVLRTGKHASVGPVDLQSGDLLLARPRGRPHPAPSVPCTPTPLLDDAIATCRALLLVTRDERNAAGRAQHSEALRAAVQAHDALTRAVETLSFCTRSGIAACTSMRKIPYYECGYYDMHLAVDCGVEDRAQWRELTTNGEACAFGDARGDELDIFSGYRLLRRAP